jgi:hypothetical protein
MKVVYFFENCQSKVVAGSQQFDRTPTLQRASLIKNRFTSSITGLFPVILGPRGCHFIHSLEAGDMIHSLAGDLEDKSWLVKKKMLLLPSPVEPF